MSKVDGSLGFQAHASTAAERRQSEGSGFFRGLLDGVGFIAQIGGKAAGLAISNNAAGYAGGLGGLGGGLAGGSGEQRLYDLLQLQYELQARMQEFSMRSNMAKTEHESRMAVVRNLRA